MITDCILTDCTRISNARGLCAPHWRWAKDRDKLHLFPKRGELKSGALAPVMSSAELARPSDVPLQCLVAGCESDAESRGCCRRHYGRLRYLGKLELTPTKVDIRAGKLLQPILPSHLEGAPAPRRRCAAVLPDGSMCEREDVQQGELCPPHTAQRRAGKELQPVRPLKSRGQYEIDSTADRKPTRAACTTPIDYLLHRVEIDQDTACWIWTGKLSDQGYPHATIDGRGVPVYRWIHEQLTGPILEGCDVDHVCPRTDCVSPFHTQVLTEEDHRRVTRERRAARKDWEALVIDGRNAAAPAMPAVEGEHQPRIILPALRRGQDIRS